MKCEDKTGGHNSSSSSKDPGCESVFACLNLDDKVEHSDYKFVYKYEYDHSHHTTETVPYVYILYARVRELL